MLYSMPKPIDTNNHEPRHVRTLIPADLHMALRHLSLDIGVSLGDLLVEGAVLLLRHHGKNPTNSAGEALRVTSPKLAQPGVGAFNADNLGPANGGT